MRKEIMQIVTGWVVVALGLSASSGVALGGSWTKADAGLARSPVWVRTLVVDPLSPSTIYAVGGSLFKSTDAGGTWSMVGGVSSVSALVINPSDSSILYAVAHGTVVKSMDGGESWTVTGFGLSSAFGLVIDPQNTSTVYAIADSAIFKTTDGGASWTAKTNGLPASLDGSLAIAATSPSTIYAKTHAGLYKSTDGGESWRGLPIGQKVCNCLVAIDPAHPSTLYAFLGGLLWKSTDGGESWSTGSAGITGFVTSLVVDSTSRIYASYIDGSFPRYTGAVITSTDGGENWSALLPSNNPPIWSLALDPANSSAILAGYFDQFTGRGGVFRTFNGGANWSDASAGLAITDIHV
jgi:photosystem II stability/assembly factor-like uncharacterized protein